MANHSINSIRFLIAILTFLFLPETSDCQLPYYERIQNFKLFGPEIEGEPREAYYTLEGKNHDIYDKLVNNARVRITKKEDLLSFNLEEFHSFFNNQAQVKSFKIENINDTGNINIYSLGLEKLNHLKEIILPINDYSDQDKLWKYLSNIENLKMLRLNSRSYTKINDSKEFQKLLSKLDELWVQNVELISNASLDKIDGGCKTICMIYSDSREYNPTVIASSIEYFSRVKNNQSLGIIIIERDIEAEIFKSLGNYTQTEKLYLRNYGLASNANIFGFLQKMKGLKSLGLNIKKETEIEGLEQLINLEELSINSKLLAEESLARIIQLSKLKKLEINVFEFHKEFGNLQELEELSLNGKNTELPTSFFELRNLKKLKISGITNNDLSMDFDKLSLLEELSISHCNNIQELNFNLPELRTLRIINVPIIKINSDLSKYKNLTELELTKTKLTELPTAIAEIKSLEKLKINGDFIPSRNEYGERHLSQFHVQFTTLPERMNQLKNLKELDLSFNLMDEELVQEIIELMADLKGSLNKVTLQSCNISNIENDRWESIELDELDLQDNSIIDIPVALYKSKIKKVNFSNSNGRSFGEFTNRNKLLLHGFYSKRIDENYLLENADAVELLKANNTLNYKDQLLNFAFRQNPEKALAELTDEELAYYFFSKKDYKKAAEYYSTHLDGNFNPTIEGRKREYYPTDLIKYLIALEKAGETELLKERLEPLFQNLNTASTDQDFLDECSSSGELTLYSEYVYLMMLYEAVEDKEKQKHCLLKAKEILQTRPSKINNLELYLIADEQENFEKEYLELLMGSQQDAFTQNIYTYLKVTKDYVHDKANKQEVKLLEKALKPIRDYGWSTDFVDYWLILKEPKNANKIYELNRMIQDFVK